MNKLWLEWVLFFNIFSTVVPHFTDITDAWQMAPNDELGGFNHLLRSPSVLDCAHHMAECDVSS